MFKVRTKFIIYPRFQWSLILGQLVCGAVVMGGILASLHFSFASLVKDGISAGLDPADPYFTLLNFQKKKIMINVGIVTAVGFLLTMVWMIFISHKVAGPIVRLRKYFLEYKTTAKKPVAFRKGDYFEDLPPAINEALKSE